MEKIKNLVKNHAEKIALTAVLLVSLTIEIALLLKNDYGNTYYAAAVRSMLQSWHNFFFVSFDPAGFISVDKPPFGLWIQTVSAFIFGYHGWSLLLPQALAHVASVGILYILVKKYYGTISALISAFVLSITPISVAVASTNQLDSTLVLILLLATWSLFTSIETKKILWLIISFILVGIGFNTKMMAAYMILPALVITYFFAIKGQWKQKILNLSIASVFLVTVSLSWAIAVDLTPAQNRPYVGSSETNSALNLALGYNGLQRLTGMQFGKTEATEPVAQSDQSAPETPTGNIPDKGTMPGPQGGGPGGFSGQPGVFRLFQQNLGGQISWLLPFAMASIFVVLTRKRLRWHLSKEQHPTILWGIWLITCGVVFSFAGFMHEYYTVLMAPALAALVGIGASILWGEYKGNSWRQWVLPIALGITAIGQSIILSYFSSYHFLIPIIGIGAGVSALILLIAKSGLHKAFSRYLLAMYILGLTSLGITSVVWTSYSFTHQINQTIVTAGPSAEGNRFGFADDNNRDGLNEDAENQQKMPPIGIDGMGEFRSISDDLIVYLEQHQENATYLVGTSSSHSADSIIIKTGKAVMAMGGFSGSDTAISLKELKSTIANGEIRYFITESDRSGFGSQEMNRQIHDGTQFLDNSNQDNTQPSPLMFGQNRPPMGGDSNQGRVGFGGQNSEISEWITKQCTLVSSDEWQSDSTESQQQSTLYDCKSVTQ
ncbi:glycosyltransferase family 39 protein [candidate division WWE3 bacterium]|nr:glycosyltransferase family 39 protein [candidate division WWE3 bacterium]